jgi:hypothetical protein
MEFWNNGEKRVTSLLGLWQCLCLREQKGGDIVADSRLSAAHKKPNIPVFHLSIIPAASEANQVHGGRRKGHLFLFLSGRKYDEKNTAFSSGFIADLIL